MQEFGTGSKYDGVRAGWDLSNGTHLLFKDYVLIDAT